jgi:hypothetical protein
MVHTNSGENPETAAEVILTSPTAPLLFMTPALCTVLPLPFSSLWIFGAVPDGDADGTMIGMGVENVSLAFRWIHNNVQ